MIKKYSSVSKAAFGAILFASVGIMPLSALAHDEEAPEEAQLMTTTSEDLDQEARESQIMEVEATPLMNTATDTGAASEDTDNDGLTNAMESAIGSDPSKVDTDADGMPDKWEFEKGTNPLEADADADPDNDFLTNLGEYNYGTKPLQGDNLVSSFTSDDLLTRFPLLWVLLAMLLGLIFGSHNSIMQDLHKKKSNK